MTTRVLYLLENPTALGHAEQAVLLAQSMDPEFVVDGLFLYRQPVPLARGGNGKWQTYRARPGNRLGAVWAIRRTLRQSRYDVVHTWDHRSTRHLAWVLASLPASDRPRVWLAHTADDDRASDDRFLLGSRRPDGWTSEQGMALPAACGHSEAVPLIAPRPRCGAAILRGLDGVNSETTLIGTACQLHARSGLKNLIWSLDQLKCVGKDVRLVIWGTGPQREDLRRYARLSAIEDWLIWRDPAEDVRREMAELDFYWHAPREWETPAAVVAALLHGVPAVAPRSDFTDALAAHWPDLLKLVSWGDRVDYTRHTFHWLEQGRPAADPDRRDAWLNQFSPSAIARTLAAIYRRRLDRGTDVRETHAPVTNTRG